jgi:hypothetical protein
MPSIKSKGLSFESLRPKSKTKQKRDEMVVFDQSQFFILNNSGRISSTNRKINS